MWYLLPPPLNTQLYTQRLPPPPPFSFPTSRHLQDLRFALGLGDAVGQALPVAAAANEQFKRARAAHGDEDFCAVVEAYRE